MDKIISSIQRWDIYDHCLVQFWRAEELDSVDDFGHRRFLLTSRNLPFLFTGFFYSTKKFRDGICSYRTWTVDINSGDSGVIGRVFRNKRMEFTPDVGYYSYEEYPHRDFALYCGIKSSFVLPWSDSSGGSLGVIEFVTPSSIFFGHFGRKLQNVCLDCCKDRCGQYGPEEDSIKNAVSEINQVMKVVGESANIVVGQTWMLCKLCDYISTCNSFGYYVSASYAYSRNKGFLVEESVYILQKEEGVVGKAASWPYNLVYCKDVAKLSIVEHPLAHVARQYKLSSCFAICLQSSNTGDQLYILEFFLASQYGPDRGLRAALAPIIETMQQNFKTFMLASGEEFGGSLSVQVIDANSPDKVVSLIEREVDLSLIEREVDLTLRIGVNNAELGGPNLLQGSIGESSMDGTDDPMVGVETSFRDTSMEEASVFSASTVQSEYYVTVKAMYGNDLAIYLRLCGTSTIHELNIQVYQRLQLDVRTYSVKYLDDDGDLISIICDDDLQDYIRSEISAGKTALTIYIEPAL